MDKNDIRGLMWAVRLQFSNKLQLHPFNVNIYIHERVVFRYNIMDGPITLHKSNYIISTFVRLSFAS